MAYSDNFPATRPVFMADFANGGKIDPRITFSRSDTPPTYAAPSAVHYWSNEKHLSSENLLLDSKTGTANWTEAASGSAATPAITANYAASPDGTASQATRVQLNLNGATDTSSNSRYNQSINLPSGDSVTFSVWLKSTDGASSYAIQVYQADGNAAAATVTGSWQKFTTTATAAGSAAFGIRLRGGQSPTNADTADVLMWGANVSTTGQTVLSETTTQIHRAYAPTLKSVSTAGQPRFEFSPTDSASMGLLIEGQSTNLATRSDEFDQWSYARVNRAANAAVAPSGNLTADLVYADGTASNTHLVQSSFTATAAPYTFSVYAKAAGCNYVRLSFENIGSGYGHFDLANGTVTASNTTSQIESVGNGWWRVSITETLSSGTSYGRISISTSSGTVYWDGDDYSGVLLSAAQIEQNSFPSSPIATSGSTVTRASDSASMDLTQAGFNGGPFSIVSETEGGQGVYPRAWTLSDGTLNNRLTFYRNSGTATTNTDWFCYGASENSAQVSSSVTGSASAGKLAVSYDTNDVSFCASGGTVVNDTSAVIPKSITTLIFGAQTNGTANKLNGHVKRVALYGEALSDTNLQALTS